MSVPSAKAGRSAVVIGASGGIGCAVADLLEQSGDFPRVWRFSRARADDHRIDLTNEASIAAAAADVAANGPPPSLIFVATGLLHSATHRPEKALKDLDATWLAQNFAINAIGPALIAKHFVPLLPRADQNVRAFLSARVGSISDNHLGGWHGFGRRASGASLHQASDAA